MTDRQEADYTPQELLKQQIINLRTQTALLELGIKAGEFFFGIISGETFAILCNRVALLIRGAWLPGKGDVRTIAGLTNKSERTIEDAASNLSRQKHYIGRQVFYRLEDFPMANADSSPKETDNG